MQDKSTTIYRGYDIRGSNGRFGIFKGDFEACDRSFSSEEKACDEIDEWKRAARKIDASL
jgi:hypothetical protein